jgi:hypothetical protein
MHPALIPAVGFVEARIKKKSEYASLKFHVPTACTVIHHHHQWHYSPDRALASLTGFRDG